MFMSQRPLQPHRWLKHPRCGIVLYVHDRRLRMTAHSTSMWTSVSLDRQSAKSCRTHQKKHPQYPPIPEKGSCHHRLVFPKWIQNRSGFFSNDGETWMPLIPTEKRRYSGSESSNHLILQGHRFSRLHLTAARFGIDVGRLGARRIQGVLFSMGVLAMTCQSRAL